MWLLIKAEVSAGWVQINLLLKIRVITAAHGDFRLIIPSPLFYHICLILSCQLSHHFVYCHLKPSLTLTLQPFFYLSHIPSSSSLTPPSYTFLVFPSAFTSSLSLSLHTCPKAHWFVKYLIHLLLFIILRFIISNFLSQLCAHSKAQRDNPVSWKCFINKPGSYEGWWLSEKTQTTNSPDSPASLPPSWKKPNCVSERAATVRHFSTGTLCLPGDSRMQDIKIYRFDLTC